MSQAQVPFSGNETAAVEFASTQQPVPGRSAPCCGTAEEAAAEGACCGTAAKQQAISTGQSCCG